MRSARPQTLWSIGAFSAHPRTGGRCRVRSPTPTLGSSRHPSSDGAWQHRPWRHTGEMGNHTPAGTGAVATYARTMSRTVIHAPWLTVPEHCQPVHDHRAGPCDLTPLDDYRRTLNNGRRRHDSRCHWDLRWHVNSRTIRTCGCPACTGYWDRRADRRRDRHDTRRRLRTTTEE